MKKLLQRSLSLLLSLMLILSMPVQVLADTWDLANGDVIINANEDVNQQTVQQGTNDAVQDSAPVITYTPPPAVDPAPVESAPEPTPAPAPSVTIQGNGQANVTVDTGSSAPAIDVNISGNVSAAEGSEVVKVESGNVDVNFTDNGSITVGDNSSGIVASGSDTNVTVNERPNAGSEPEITVNGENASGVVASDGATVTTDKADIQVNNGTGVVVDDAKVEMNDSVMNVAGDNSTGVEFTGDGTVDFKNNTTVNVSGNNAAGVEVSGDGSDANILSPVIGVTGENSTGVLVSGDNTNVLIDDVNNQQNNTYYSDDIHATGNNASAVKVTGNNATVKVDTAELYAENGDTVVIEGKDVDSKVNLTLKGTTITSSGGSAIDLSSFFINHFDVDSYTNITGQVVTVSGKELVFEPHKLTGNDPAPNLFTQDLMNELKDNETFKEFIGSAEYVEYTKADGFSEYLGIHEAIGDYYMISPEAIQEAFGDYYDVDQDSSTENLPIYVRQDSKGAFIVYPATNPNAVATSRYYAKKVYLTPVQNELDVTLTVEGTNNVTSKDKEFADQNSAFLVDGTQSGVTVDDCDEEGNIHAAIHVTEDDLTITTEEGKSGTLNATATDVHYVGYQHWHYYYSNGGWRRVKVTHYNASDLATGAAIGTNGTYHSNADWSNPSYCPSFAQIEGDKVYEETLTGTIKIEGNTIVNASEAPFKNQYGDDCDFDGAGIGTGYGSSIGEDGKIIIGGNAIVNTTGKNAAAIGSGQARDDGDGTFTGGEMNGTISIGEKATVKVVSENGAAIGSGQNGNMGGDITVDGNAKIEGTTTYTTSDPINIRSTYQVVENLYYTYNKTYTVTNGVCGYSGCTTAVEPGTDTTHTHTFEEMVPSATYQVVKYVTDDLDDNVDPQLPVDNTRYNESIQREDEGYTAPTKGTNGIPDNAIEIYFKAESKFIEHETKVEYTNKPNAFATSTNGAAIGSGKNGSMTESSSITIGGDSKVLAQSTSGAAIGTGFHGDLSGEITVKDNAQLVDVTEATAHAISKVELTYWYWDDEDPENEKDGKWVELPVTVNVTSGFDEVAYEEAFQAAYKDELKLKDADDETAEFQYPAHYFTKEVIYQNKQLTAEDQVGVMSAYGAAIGTGQNGKITETGKITISGGQVNAQGGNGAAAIGTGSLSGTYDYLTQSADVDGTITISGNAEIVDDSVYKTVTTTKTYSNDTNHKLISDVKNEIVETERKFGATNGGNAAAIGTGGHGNLNGKINVFDNALVLATVNDNDTNSAAIGTGWGVAGNNHSNITGSIDILGGRIQLYTEVITNQYKDKNVNNTEGSDPDKKDYSLVSTKREEKGILAGAVGSNNGAGIGSGSNGNISGSITIENSKVIAKSGNTGAAIGAGYWGDLDGNITIKGSTVNATAGNFGAAIGSGDDGQVTGEIRIVGSNVTASSKSGAAIGSGDDSNNDAAIDETSAFFGKIVITDSAVNVVSDTGAGIGTGKGNELLGDIIISGNSDVVAVSYQAAAIGTGYGANTYLRAIQSLKTAKESEAGPYVEAKEGEEVAFTDPTTNKSYHKLTAQELADMKEASRQWEKRVEEWLAEEGNDGKDADAYVAAHPDDPDPYRIRYFKKTPTIHILDTSNVETYTDPNKTDDVNTYGVIGVAQTEDHLEPTKSLYNHVYVLSNFATINGRQYADQNWLLNFMNLDGTNLFWQMNKKHPGPEPEIYADEVAEKKVGDALYWVTEVDDLSILMDHEDETKNGELTVVAEKDDAAFVTYNHGLDELQKMGVKTIVFKSGSTESKFDVSDALGELGGGHLVVYHENGQARMTLGGQDCDLLK